MIGNTLQKIFSFLLSIVDRENKMKILKFFKKKIANQYITVLDIGAHKGETIELFNRAFNINKIYSFEPNVNLFKFLKSIKKYSNNNKIEIFNLGFGDKNEQKKLNISLKKDKKLFDVIIKNNPRIITKKFIYSVQISKLKYLEMINNRYISTLLNFTDKEIINGLNEVIRKYKKILKFKDRLICFIIKK